MTSSQRAVVHVGQTPTVSARAAQETKCYLPAHQMDPPPDLEHEGLSFCPEYDQLPGESISIRPEGHVCGEPPIRHRGGM